MKKIIRKRFWAWDFDKEEQWLNNMAKEGWVLAEVGFCKFVFEQCEKGEYTIRLNYLKSSPKTQENKEYIAFIEETGAEQVGTINNWVYFRKKVKEGEFEIFSDTSSRYNHLKKIFILLFTIGFINVFPAISNLYLFFTQSSRVWYINSFGFINFIFAVFLFSGCNKIYKKMRELIKNKGIYE